MQHDLTGYKRAECSGKEPFSSKAVALMVANKLGSKVYRCRFCDAWHVGGGKINSRVPGRRR